ncbi:GntR family transcriptional regulator [Bordetella holmesii]|uniref:FCD domain protein n=2 Tax=Bordetella holmesii TaxID=35814 RepID=A0A158M7X7_9BORD|nr:GntR family transcriptional regulator [Bordetella holmesii]AHV92534.1 bacterial regulatory s, gntR family protein [Bordetella holmesii ATCC 51541]AIT25115.1 bacterial regulatory s, gntR family protein [Bordetella holmesii 44057]EWM45678.1 bacterial regulatory s, gntR family protein [Bordetella holmesii 70147]EWM48819.1 bacterial regulatory s, gntR family protein [Bordetella holmesii 41130]EWM49802.1 bacterial regulatory s, gntR family protein [Bordetella holmesii 35009]
MQLHPEKLPVRTDFVDTVYRVLLDAITDGSLAPGERITQEEIAEQLHVSRSPVLQALRLLKKDGFIEDAPGRGVQVTQLDPAWVAHLYEVRGALDALAARLAAQARAVIDPTLIERGRIAARSADLKTNIESDLAFHNAIYDASGNPLIGESARHYWVHLRRVMGAVHRSAAHRSTLWDEHAAIAQAIASGDARLAVRLSDQHIEHARSNLVGQLQDILDR